MHRLLLPASRKTSLRGLSGLQALGRLSLDFRSHSPSGPCGQLLTFSGRERRYVHVYEYVSVCGCIYRVFTRSLRLETPYILDTTASVKMFGPSCKQLCHDHLLLTRVSMQFSICLTICFSSVGVNTCSTSKAQSMVLTASPHRCWTPYASRS